MSRIIKWSALWLLMLLLLTAGCHSVKMSDKLYVDTLTKQTQLNTMSEVAGIVLDPNGLLISVADTNASRDCCLLAASVMKDIDDYAVMTGAYEPTFDNMAILISRFWTRCNAGEDKACAYGCFRGKQYIGLVMDATEIVDTD